MPYPPTFSGVWDITFPPDTQLANQLGADLRSLRVDVMQRMSLLSGMLANRPTPETVNATWGGAGFGLLYFSTDNGKIYQWNGGGWSDVSNSFTGSSKIVIPNASVGLDIPANTLEVGDVLDITFNIGINNGVGGSTTGFLQVAGNALGTFFNFAHPNNLSVMARAKLIVNNIGVNGVIYSVCDYVPGIYPTSVQLLSGGVVDTTAPINVIGMATPTGGASVVWGPLSVLIN